MSEGNAKSLSLSDCIGNYSAMLSNFISVSISNKKREIGILRAVGARSLDVFKIFFSESFVIGLICVLFSSGISMWLCNTINMEYPSGLLFGNKNS